MIRSSRYSGFDFRDLHVLVVEDEEFARTVTCQVLRGFSCARVLSAEDGQQATDMLTSATRSFDLVICDFKMPAMNGLELLKLVRRGLPGVARDLPFALLTSHSDKAIVGAAFELDVDCIMIKPVTAATMRGRITRVMATDRPIKAPFDYHDNAPDGVGAAAGSRAAAGEVVARPRGDGQRTPLSEVRYGAVLARSIVTSGGHVLVTSGETLDQRTIERLQELAELDPAVREVQITR